jgi:4-hydroxybenzoate polyprenyltransferase
VILGVASLALVAIYPCMKRITWWPQAWLGLTFNWGILMGFAAASGGVPLALWAVDSLSGRSHGRWMADSAGPWGSLPSLAACLLYAGAVLWTIGYDTIYATQDLEDDALVGVKSAARRLGARAPAAVLGLYVAAFVLALAAAFSGGAQPLFWPVTALYGIHLSRQAQRFRTDDPALALAIFRSNALAGLILFAALCAGSFHAGWMSPR